MTSTSSRIPLAVKLVYTAFVAVLVPVYWRDYGPTNFLYFCDVSLLLTLVAVWKEEALLASIAAVGIVLPQTLWMADFLAEAVGLRLTGMTCYMYDGKYPLFTRFLSFFHFWLPLLLLWLVWRLGYDRRALLWCAAGSCVLLLVCYFFMPPPPAPADNPNLPVNINYVHGFSLDGPQTTMPPLAYLGLLMLALPLGLQAPAHFLFARWLPPVRRAESA